MTRNYGAHISITRQQAQDAWIAVKRGGVKALADYLCIHPDRASWLIDIHNLWSYIPDEQQMIASDGMTEYEFQSFMRELDDTVDEIGWLKK